MFTFAYRLTGREHDAEDLVQDVVVKLYPRLDELESVDHIRPWLHRVLYRHFIDTIRKRPAGREINTSALDLHDDQTPFLETRVGSEPDPLANVEGDIRSRTLKRLLGELHPDQRTLLLLHDADGWRQEDIAEVLDVPIGTIKSRLHRTRALLRTKLQEELEPFGEQLRGLQ